MEYGLVILSYFMLTQAKLVPQQLRVSTRSGIETITLVVGQRSNNEIESMEDLDIFEINKDLDLIGGDIIPSSKTFSSLLEEADHWDTTEIPVAYMPGLNLLAIASIEEARREYELRTCLRFVDRTDQRNYILFRALNGCFSSVGQVGGFQTISIGSGCERMSTVIHEIMHAIGIYHEQSRTDRDDYVRIALENVDDGKEHNFNTYDYDFVDDRRVSYDYNSVMHYGDTSFSNNGLPTIVTHDPAFQDVIGQRRTFSEGDVTKINRMYKCSDTIRRSYTCDYESTDVCGYVQENPTDEAAGWFRYTVGKVNQVVTPATVPGSDGSHGITGKGSFMIFNTINSIAGKVASMKSMVFKSVAPHQCLEFSYYMDLVAGSGALMKVYIATIDPLSGDIQELGSPVTTLAGNHESEWNTERLTIEAPSQYRLVFEATSGSQSSDLIAIDDVNVIDKPCESNYFVIKNYAELIDSASQGDYLYSPVLYTEDGYAVQLMVYPVGRVDSAPGYMALFFMLAKGVNDDKLQWPFHNRLVKMSVVDQQSDTLTRMNQFSNYFTAEGGPWEKPVTSRNSGYGYRSFMSLSEITNTRNFIKHNSLMISVDVTDMSQWINATTSADQSQVVRLPNADYLAVESDQHEQQRKFSTELNSSIGEEKHEQPVSESAAVAIAVACGSIVFVLIVFVLFAFSYQHQKQMGDLFDTLTKRNRFQTYPDNKSASFSVKSRKDNVNMTA